VERVQNNLKKRKLNDGTAKVSENDETYDIWETDDIDTRDKIVKKYPVAEKEYLENRKRKVKVPESMRDKSSEFKAVEVMKPGASYNPTEVEHKMLLKEAVDEQVKYKKAYDKVMRTLKKNRKEGTSFKEDMPLIPVELGDVDNVEEQVSDEDTPMEHVNIPIIPRLTQAEINKKKRKIVHEAIVKNNTLKKSKKQENIMDIISEVDKEHFELNERKLKQQKRKSNPTKRLGKERFYDKEVEVLLTEELPQSLKDIKPVTDLFEDTIKNMQKRNLIEVRTRKNYDRRYPLKFKVKIRHREFETEQEKKYANL